MEKAIMNTWRRFENEGGIYGEIRATVHYTNEANIKCFSRHYTAEDTKLFAKIHEEKAKDGKVEVIITFKEEKAIIKKI